MSLAWIGCAVYVARLTRLFCSLNILIGFSVQLVANEEDLITYDRENDRETELMSKQRKMTALDYFYTKDNISVVFWTDTASQYGESSGVVRNLESCGRKL